LRVLLREAAAAETEEMLVSASRVASSRLLYVEARAAIAAAHRAGRMRRRVLDRVRRRLDELVDSVYFIELDALVASAAGEVAERYRLRAADALHLASALVPGDRRLVVASWDGELRRAALEAGLAVFPARVT
jgi:predicted nucleic acid-binding protein